MLAPIRWSVLNAHGREHTLAQWQAEPTTGGNISCVVLAETTCPARYVPQSSALAYLDYLSRGVLRHPRVRVVHGVRCRCSCRRAISLYAAS